MAIQDEVILSNKVVDEIEMWLKRFPEDQRRSAVIPALMAVQKDNKGWLTEELVSAVADYLGIARVAAMEVATFYSMFELEPVGRHKISICTNVSCMLCGSNEVVEHLKSKLKVDFGETTADGKFTLKEVECLAACGGAPAMQLNDDYYENLTPAKLDKILAELE